MSKMKRTFLVEVISYEGSDHIIRELMLEDVIPDVEIISVKEVFDDVRKGDSNVG